jgi:hypothetical protein
MDGALDIEAETKIIIRPGYFLTTYFRNKHEDLTGTMVVSEDDPDVIYYDPDTVISLHKRSHYAPKSKQLYIIENMLKTIINARKVLYLDNTERYVSKDYQGVEHLYGLASGWKTYRLARDIGLSNLKSITVYDFNERQLDHARSLHQNVELADTTLESDRTVGNYDPPADIKEFWSSWHSFPIKFEKIDLFDLPRFPTRSLVWISNVFKYEPTLFTYGWDRCKQAKQSLIEINKDSIITEE